MKLELEFIPDDDAERHLKKLGIKYTIERSPVSAVNREWSRSNGARLGEKLDPNHAEELAQYARQGNAFKRSVCVEHDFHADPEYRTKSDKTLGILGGNHRDEGYVRAGVTEFEYYLIKKDGLDPVEWKHVLPRLLNSLPVKPLSEAHKVRTALHWQEKGIMSFEEAAEMFGLKVEFLNQRKKQQGIVKLLNDAKVPNADLYLESTRFAPFATLGTDRVKVRSAILAIKADYTKAECQALANLLRTKPVAKDEATQLAQIDKIEEQLAVERTKAVPPTSAQAVRTTWLRNWHAALKFMEGKTKLQQLGIDTSYRFYEDTLAELNTMQRLCRVLRQSAQG